MFAFTLLGLGQSWSKDFTVSEGPEFDKNWAARDAIIQKHNSENHGWTMRHNERFLGQPVGAAKNLLGTILRSPTDTFDQTVINQHPKFPNMTLAKRFESAE